MTRLVLAAFALICALAVSATAGTRVSGQAAATAKPEADKAQAAWQKLHDHPKVQPVKNPDVKIEVTSDKIIRSCCKAPDLLVVGTVTNVSSRPIDYVQLFLTFRDEDGKAVHSEDAYNQKAATMGEDPEIARILNESPHFDPLLPGVGDTFQFYIPLPDVPRHRTVELSAGKVVRDSKPAVAKAPQ